MQKILMFWNVGISYVPEHQEFLKMQASRRHSGHYRGRRGRSVRFTKKWDFRTFSGQVAQMRHRCWAACRGVVRSSISVPNPFEFFKPPARSSTPGFRRTSGGTGDHGARNFFCSATSSDHHHQAAEAGKNGKSHGPPRRALGEAIKTSQVSRRPSPPTPRTRPAH